MLVFVVTFAYYHRMARKQFGGLSGDLAGWFVQTAELLGAYCSDRSSIWREDTMMFITGPMFSGKKTWVCESLGLSLQELTSRAVWDVQELAATADDLEMLCDDLCQFDIVIATEVGGGIVPVDAARRADSRGRR